MVHTRDLRHEPWRYRLRAFVSKPANLLLVFFLIVLVLLSLMPMATMLSNFMFTVHVGTEKSCCACRSAPPRSGISNSSPGTIESGQSSGSRSAIR